MIVKVGALEFLPLNLMLFTLNGVCLSRFPAFWLIKNDCSCLECFFAFPALETSRRGVTSSSSSSELQSFCSFIPLGATKKPSSLSSASLWRLLLSLSRLPNSSPTLCAYSSSSSSSELSLMKLSSSEVQTSNLGFDLLGWTLVGTEFLGLGAALEGLEGLDLGFTITSYSSLSCCISSSDSTSLTGVFFALLLTGVV